LSSKYQDTRKKIKVMNVMNFVLTNFLLSCVLIPVS